MICVITCQANAASDWLALTALKCFTEWVGLCAEEGRAHMVARHGQRVMDNVLLCLAVVLQATFLQKQFVQTTTRLNYMQAYKLRLQSSFPNTAHNNDELFVKRTCLLDSTKNVFNKQSMILENLLRPILSLAQFSDLSSRGGYVFNIRSPKQWSCPVSSCEESGLIM